VEDLLAGFGQHAPVFERTRRAGAGCVHANGGDNRLRRRKQPLLACACFSFVVFIIAAKGRFRGSAVFEGFIFCAWISLNLRFAIRPGGVDPRLSSLPNNVILLFRHRSIVALKDIEPQSTQSTLRKNNVESLRFPRSRQLNKVFALTRI
jgi:hypothetical protein